MTQCESSRAECILLCLAYSYLPSPWLADFSFLTDPALLISNGFFREVPDFLFGPEMTQNDRFESFTMASISFVHIQETHNDVQEPMVLLKKELCRHSKLLLLYFVEAIKSCGLEQQEENDDDSFWGELSLNCFTIFPISSV